MKTDRQIKGLVNIRAPRILGCFFSHLQKSYKKSFKFAIIWWKKHIMLPKPALNKPIIKFFLQQIFKAKISVQG